MVKKYVWTCDFCSEEFSTKSRSDRHELKCKKNPNNTEPYFSSDRMFQWASIALILYFFTYFVINSYATSNGYQTMNPVAPWTWLKKETNKNTNPVVVIPTKYPTQIPTSTTKPAKKVVVNANPNVNCLIDTKCGGPRLISKAQCDSVTCCQIGNSYYLLPNLAKCKEEQTKWANLSNPNNYKVNVTWPTLPPMKQYVVPTFSVNIPTYSQPPQANTNNYSAICNGQLQIDTINAKTIGGSAGEVMSRLAQENYDRCMQTGVSQPLQVQQNKPTPTPTIIGIWNP